MGAAWAQHGGMEMETEIWIDPQGKGYGSIGRVGRRKTEKNIKNKERCRGYLTGKGRVKRVCFDLAGGELARLTGESHG